jgi:hypothetical protein
VTEPTTQQRLAEAIEPFRQAAHAFHWALDEEVWIGDPRFRLTFGDLRRLVAAVDRANA